LKEVIANTAMHNKKGVLEDCADEGIVRALFL
jgi:hypothetical protein